MKNTIARKRRALWTEFRKLLTNTFFTKTELLHDDLCNCLDTAGSVYLPRAETWDTLKTFPSELTCMLAVFVWM